MGLTPNREVPTLHSHNRIHVQVLCELGADLDAVDGCGNTALIDASSEGHVGMVKLLHEAKADLNVCGDAGTAVHWAARRGDKATLQVTHTAEGGYTVYI